MKTKNIVYNDNAFNISDLSSIVQMYENVFYF